LYWFVRRPRVNGVKCVLTDRSRVLLVRHTYGSRDWDLPGGSMKRKEAPVQAARREMREELGIEVDDWVSVGEVPASMHHRRDVLHCFQVELHDPALTIDRCELAAVRWFSRRELPADLSRYVRPVLAKVPAS
jgi:8-oxo-dGTP pyrophosphatase MutT (NUDIX family)